MILPLILKIGFATITLDDGHLIESPFIKKGEVYTSSGFLIKVGDMADIQSSLNGNSCLIRVSEIKTRFEKETKSIIKRCGQRIDIFQKSLDESKRLNKNLKIELKTERSNYKKLLIGSIVTTVALTATSIYLIKH